MRVAVLVVAVLTAGCGPRLSAATTDDEWAATTSTSTAVATDTGGATMNTTSSPPSPPLTTEAGAETATSSTSGTDDAPAQWCHWSDGNRDLGVDGVCDRVENSDSGEGGEAGCDPWNDECGEGDKCYGFIDAAFCGPVAQPARQMHESCEVSEASDNCDRGLVCYGDICVGACQCAIDFRHCADPDTRCSPSGTGIEPCLQPCDPLTPECPPGFYCSGGADGFLCYGGARDGSCHGNPKCAEGFECLEVNVEIWGPGVPSGQRVPDCTTRDRGCCAELCSLSAGVCSDPRMICSPMGTLPEWEGCTFDAGVCLLPE